MQDRLNRKQIQQRNENEKHLAPRIVSRSITIDPKRCPEISVYNVTKHF